MSMVSLITNPLLIDHILEHVFGYCGWNALKACRQTCKLWYNRSEKQWKIKAPARKLFEKQKYGKTKSVLNGTGSSALTYSPCLAKYPKFQLFSFNFRNDWNTRYVFWVNRGQFITEIELVNCCITSAKACRGLLYGEATPLLQTLKLDNVSYSFLRYKEELPDAHIPNRRESMRKLIIIYEDRLYGLPISWTSVFECFPNLEILMLRKTSGLNLELARILEGIASYYDRHQTRHTLKCLKALRLPLKNLKNFPDALLSHFRRELRVKPNGSIALEKLVSALGQTFYTQDILELLSYQRNSLKVVKMYQELCDSPNGLVPMKNFELPQMLNLTRLDLWDFPIISFRFLIECPSLKTLNWIAEAHLLRELNRWNAIRDETDWTLAEKQELILPSLTSFHCNAAMNWNNSDLILLGRWLPNVTSLAIHSADLSFEGLCSSFPKLTRLFLDEAKISDNVFTGIYVSPEEFSQVDPTTFQRRPNITNLNKLEEIVIRRESDQRNYNGRLSEFAAREGLLRLPYLRKVAVSTCVMMRVGRRALRGSSSLSVHTYTFPSIKKFIRHVQ